MATSQPLGVPISDFSVDGARWERGPGGMPFLVVATDQCQARLTPYGGQLCEWTPAGQVSPVLFIAVAIPRQCVTTSLP